MKSDKDKDFSRLGEAIKKIIHDLGLAEEIVAWQAVLRWQEIVGEKVAKYAKAVEVKEGILYLSCPNPTWRSQLLLMKKEIINKANRVIGKEAIKDIKFLRGRD
ncbi:MAG: DUF721 domain-containing protein [candidate division WOR-3 bacterium]